MCLCVGWGGYCRYLNRALPKQQNHCCVTNLLTDKWDQLFLSGFTRSVIWLLAWLIPPAQPHLCPEAPPPQLHSHSPDFGRLSDIFTPVCVLFPCFHMSLPIFVMPRWVCHSNHILQLFPLFFLHWPFSCSLVSLTFKHFTQLHCPRCFLGFFCCFFFGLWQIKALTLFGSKLSGDRTLTFRNASLSSLCKHNYTVAAVVAFLPLLVPPFKDRGQKGWKPPPPPKHANTIG